MIHTIKLRAEFCDAVLYGDKCFEIRYNDRDYKVGDIIHFKPVNADGTEYYHRITNRVYKITYVIGGWGLKDGFVVFGIKEIGSDTLEDYI